MPFKGKSGDYQIKSIEQATHEEHVICTVYHLYPQGHIVVLPYKELVPIKSFSVISDFNLDSKGYEYAVLENIKAIYKFLQSYEQGESEDLETIMKNNWDQWNKIIQIDLKEMSACRLELTPEKSKVGISNFVLKDTKNNIQLEGTTALPLLETKWSQSSPYWNNCPTLDGEQCVVGCVATAMVQIMRYYKWPKYGEGSHSYNWSKGNRWLDADFSDSYDWDYMPNETGEYDTEQEKDAVAELCYEAGVSVEMAYGTAGSSAYTSDVAEALKIYFKYSDTTKFVYRMDYGNVDNWFEVLKEQRDLSRPLELSIYSEDSGHAVVVDGYLISDGRKDVHINMGWGGYYDAYYTLDDIQDYTDTYWQSAVIDIIPLGEQIELDNSSLSFSGVEGQSNPSPQEFKIRNAEEGELDYQVSTNKNWISVSPTSGASTGEWDTITVSINISSLTEGSYSGAVLISSENAANSPQQVTANLTVQPPPIYAPLNFSGTQVENKSLLQIEYINVLTWKANPQNRRIEKYRIYKLEGQNQTLIKELDLETFEYWHRKQDKEKECQYALVAVDDKNREGDPAYLTVQGVSIKTRDTQSTKTRSTVSEYKLSKKRNDTSKKDMPGTMMLNSNKSIITRLIKDVYSPINFTGKRVLNRSLSSPEYLNVLTWKKNPNNVNIVKYRIYQVEGDKKNLLVELNADSLEYVHRKVEKIKKYTYILVAVDDSNRESEAAYIEVN